MGIKPDKSNLKFLAMKLRKDLNSLTALSLEVPALSEEKEGLLKGGFCAISTVGMGLMRANGTCQPGCSQNSCDGVCPNDNGVCQPSCSQNSCKGQCGCLTTDPECTGPDCSDPESTNPTEAGGAMFGFSLVF